MIIGMECMTWYGAYVNQQSSSRALFTVADQLVERWRDLPTDRVDVEMAMAEIVTDVVGDTPIDLLDLTVGHSARQHCRACVLSRCRARSRLLAGTADVRVSPHAPHDRGFRLAGYRKVDAVRVSRQAAARAGLLGRFGCSGR